MLPECYLSTVIQKVMVDAFNTQLLATQAAAAAQVGGGQALAPIPFTTPPTLNDGLEGCFSIDGEENNPTYPSLKATVIKVQRELSHKNGNANGQGHVPMPHINVDNSQKNVGTVVSKAPLGLIKDVLI